MFIFLVNLRLNKTKYVQKGKKNQKEPKQAKNSKFAISIHESDHILFNPPGSQVLDQVLGWLSNELASVKYPKLSF